jgi:hypothetical protein
MSVEALKAKGIVGNRVAIEEPHLWMPNFYTFFQGHDGENFLYKNMIMLKYSSLATFFSTVADVTLFERVGVVPAMQRTIFYAYPLIGGGLAYTFALSAIAGIRKEDGRLNHYLAGHAAGAVIGAAKKSFLTGLIWGAAIGFYGTLYKTSILEGWDMYPDMTKINKEVGYPMSYKHDMTILSEFPQRWVREAPVEKE